MDEKKAIVTIKIKNKIQIEQKREKSQMSIARKTIANKMTTSKK